MKKILTMIGLMLSTCIAQPASELQTQHVFIPLNSQFWRKEKEVIDSLSEPWIRFPRITYYQKEVPYRIQLIESSVAKGIGEKEGCQVAIGEYSFPSDFQHDFILDRFVENVYFWAQTWSVAHGMALALTQQSQKQANQKTESTQDLVEFSVFPSEFGREAGFREVRVKFDVREKQAPYYLLLGQHENRLICVIFVSNEMMKPGDMESEWQSLLKLIRMRTAKDTR